MAYNQVQERVLFLIPVSCLGRVIYILHSIVNRLRSPRPRSQLRRCQERTDRPSFVVKLSLTLSVINMRIGRGLAELLSVCGMTCYKRPCILQ